MQLRCLEVGVAEPLNYVPRFNFCMQSPSARHLNHGDLEPNLVHSEKKQ